MSHVSGKPFGKPKYSVTEGREFTSWKEFDEYADRNELVHAPSPFKSSVIRSFVYDKKTGKVIELERKE